MEVLLALLLLCLVTVFVAKPLWHRPSEAGPEEAREAELAELEARKEAKYREIRDTELDHASGKLSEEEFTRQDAELRSDALEILDLIDRAKKRENSH